MELESLKFVIWYLVIDDLLPFISFYVKTYLFFNDSLTYVMNYTYLYIIYLFLFTESIILRFTVQIYDLIYKILLTIQRRIPILTTWIISQPTKLWTVKSSNLSDQFTIGISQDSLREHINPKDNRFTNRFSKKLPVPRLDCSRS